MGFRENLKDELEYKGIKVKDLAEKTEISRRTIDQYLASVAKIPSVTNAVKIARALNVSVEFLVDGTKSKEGIPAEYKKLIEDYESLSEKDKSLLRVIIEEMKK